MKIIELPKTFRPSQDQYGIERQVQTWRGPVWNRVSWYHRNENEWAPDQIYRPISTDPVWFKPDSPYTHKRSLNYDFVCAQAQEYADVFNEEFRVVRA